jgi:hypothetical protein
MATQAAKSAAHLKSISPQFLVQDVIIAAEYYRFLATSTNFPFTPSFAATPSKFISDEWT